MCREWWEFKDDESRIMSLYRRFDAENHLPAELGFDGVRGLRRNDDLERIIEGVATIIPATALDFMAQSVMLKFAGKISLTDHQLKTYIQQLDHYVESEYEPGNHPEVLIEDEVLHTWIRFWGPKGSVAQIG